MSEFENGDHRRQWCIEYRTHHRTHAQNVMETLGVSQYFEDIFDIQTVNYVSKPARHSYTTVVHILGTEPEKCVYIDDKVQNLKEPKLMGMKTILISDKQLDRCRPDFVADDLADAVSKIIYYDTNTNTFGSWKNDVCIVADDADGNLHQDQAESLVSGLSGYNVKKLYFDF